MKPAASKQNGPREYQKTGDNTRQRQLKERGGKEIDGRTRPGKIANKWFAFYVSDLGGWDTLSTQQKTYLERGRRHVWRLVYIDDFETEYAEKHGTIINRRSKNLLSVTQQSVKLEEQLAKIVERLGGRVAKEIDLATRLKALSDHQPNGESAPDSR